MDTEYTALRFPNDEEDRVKILIDDEPTHQGPDEYSLRHSYNFEDLDKISSVDDLRTA